MKNIETILKTISVQLSIISGGLIYIALFK